MWEAAMLADTARDVFLIFTVLAVFVKNACTQTFLLFTVTNSALASVKWMGSIKQTIERQRAKISFATPRAGATTASIEEKR